MRKRTGPSIWLIRSPIHSPKARFSSGVVRISVTDGLWMTKFRPLNRSGTVSRAPKLTMSRAPQDPTHGSPSRSPRRNAVASQGNTPPTIMSATSVVVMSRKPGQQAGMAKCLHRLAAGAGRVEDEAIVILLKRFLHRLYARRCHAEHGYANRRPRAGLRAAISSPLGIRATMPASAWAALASTRSEIRLRP